MKRRLERECWRLLFGAAFPTVSIRYSGSRDGVVQAWNIRERREEKIERPMVGHSDMIMDLHYLDRCVRMERSGGAA
jgi:hypothetical protein